MGASRVWTDRFSLQSARSLSTVVPSGSEHVVGKRDNDFVGVIITELISDDRISRELQFVVEELAATHRLQAPRHDEVPGGAHDPLLLNAHTRLEMRLTEVHLANSYIDAAQSLLNEFDNARQ